MKNNIGVTLDANPVVVYPKSITIKINAWYYGAFAIPSPEKDSPKVQWYSVNDNIAKVDAMTGHIYGTALGTTRIYAQALDGSGACDYITVKVET